MKEKIKDFFGVFFVCLAIASITWALVTPSLVEAATTRQNFWTELHAPSSATQATIAHAAVTGKSHIVECVSASLAALTSAPTAVNVNVVVKDGSTVVAQWPMSLAAVGGGQAPILQLCGLRIHGTAGASMTIEFSGSAGSNTIESVFMQGRTE